MKTYMLVMILSIHFVDVKSQILKISLRDSMIYKIVESYRDHDKIPTNQYGVFLLELRVNDSLLKPIYTSNYYERTNIINKEEPIVTYSGRIIFTSMVEGVELNPPDFYSIYKSDPVLFYSGMNFLIVHSRKEIQTFYKELEKILVGKAKNYNFSTKSREFFVTDKNFIFKD